MNLLGDIDAAYIAGLVDADGTVTLTRTHRNENRRAAVSISNTDKQLLGYVRSAVGAGSISSKRIAKTHHTPSYIFAVHNRQALELLEQIQPFLRTYKVVRAKLILRDYIRLTPRNGKYSKHIADARRRFEIQVLSVKPGHIKITQV